MTKARLVLVELGELRKRRKQEWLKKSRNEMSGWVCCNQEGNPADAQNMKNRHFFKLCRI